LLTKAPGDNGFQLQASEVPRAKVVPKVVKGKASAKRKK
jgi:hypothetical protein